MFQVRFRVGLWLISGRSTVGLGQGRSGIGLALIQGRSRVGVSGVGLGLVLDGPGCGWFRVILG